MEQAMISTLLGKVLPWFNVFVAIMPAEGHFEKVWWISMLQGVLFAALYMCMLANEKTVGEGPPIVQEELIGDGRITNTVSCGASPSKFAEKSSAAGDVC